MTASERQPSVPESETEESIYISRALVDIQQQFSHVPDVQEIVLRGREAFSTLWDKCFGRDGYMNTLSHDARNEAKHMIAIAYVLAEYGHQHQNRKSNEAYIHHPVRVAAAFCAKYRQNVETVCAGLLHDIIEDSGDYGHPVTFADIHDLVGNNTYISAIVDGLSKVRADIKQQEFGLTVEKILEMSLEYPAVIGLKIYDRLDNMFTIASLSPSKQRRIAWETIKVFAPLAYFAGYRQEYHQLMNMAHIVLAREDDPKLLDRTQFLIEHEPDTNVVTPMLQEMLRVHPELAGSLRREPLHFHHVYTWVKRTIENPEFAQLLYVPLEVTLADVRDFISLGKQRFELVYTLTVPKDSPFSVPPDRNMGFTLMTDQYKSENQDLPTIFYLRYGSIILALRIWNETSKCIYETNLSTCTAINSIDESDVTNEKLEYIHKKLQYVRQWEGSGLDISWLLGSTLERNLIVEVGDGATMRRIPLGLEATTFDAIILGSDHWDSMKTGQPFPSMTAELHEGSQIICPKGERYIDPEWFYAMKTSTMVEDEFRVRLKDYWMFVNKSEDQEAIIHLEKKISALGRHIFVRSIPFLERFSPERILKRYNTQCNQPIDPVTFYRECAFGTYDNEFEKLRDAFVHYWKSLYTVTLRVGDGDNTEEMTLRTFRQHYTRLYKRAYGKKPSLDAVIVSSGWDENGNTWIMQRKYDPHETDVELLNKVAATINGVSF